MESRKLTESVLRPVTLFLDEALGQVETSAELSQTAIPLIQAIEAIPGAGRVAVYLGEHGEATLAVVQLPPSCTNPRPLLSVLW